MKFALLILLGVTLGHVVSVVYDYRSCLDDWTPLRPTTTAEDAKITRTYCAIEVHHRWRWPWWDLDDDDRKAQQ